MLGTLVRLDDVEQREPPCSHARKQHRVGRQVRAQHAQLHKALPHVPNAQAGDLALDAPFSRLGPLEHQVERAVHAVARPQRPFTTPLVDRHPRILQVVAHILLISHYFIEDPLAPVVLQTRSPQLEKVPALPEELQLRNEYL